MVSPLTTFELHPEKIQQIPLFVQMPEDRFEQGEVVVTIEIEGTSGAELERELKLMGPVR